jgi:hypothetical protein
MAFAFSLETITNDHNGDIPIANANNQPSLRLGPQFPEFLNRPHKDFQHHPRNKKKIAKSFFVLGIFSHIISSAQIKAFSIYLKEAIQPPLLGPLI